MLNSRLDQEDVDVDSFQSIVDSLEDAGERDADVAIAESFRRYSGPLADYMMDLRDEAEQSQERFVSEITIEPAEAAESLGGGKQVIGRMLTEVEKEVEYMANGTSYRIDVSAVPDVAEQLRKLDERPTREEESRRIREIIEEEGPVQGPEIIEAYEEMMGYRMTENQLENRIRDHLDSVKAVDEGYTLGGNRATVSKGLDLR